MSALEPFEKPPGKVLAIGIMHLICGILNLIMSVVWLVYGLVMGIATFGIGCVFCGGAVITLPMGIFEIMSAISHLSKKSRITNPKMLAIFEICCILTCNIYSLISGILTLVFLTDPEVDAYYKSKS